MSDTNESGTKQDSLAERTDAATGNRTLAEIEEEEKTSTRADSEVPSPDASTPDREANKDVGTDAGDPM